MSSIDVAKSLMQYQGISPNAQQCRVCAYGKEANQERAGRYHCSKGMFFVGAVSTCKEWLNRKPGVAA
jgi:hypothetical protein